jgi:gliding motility-associated-like protein
LGPGNLSTLPRINQRAFRTHLPTHVMNLMQRLSYNLLLPLATLLVANSASGQQFSITAGSITTCAGVLEDSGGPAASYGTNENFTVVICPDQPGDGISLTWAVFNLDQSGANNTWDAISIWDGDNTGATFLGNYGGGGLLGLVVSATTFNPTGCLTVRFNSNGTGVGDFAASITCFTPCDRPEAVASMSEPGPALVCQGEVIDFDGSLSTAAMGFNIVSYTWVFDDGSTATGPTASHSYSVPGEYIVQLNLIDDNDCVNSNVVDLQVLVSTTPSFMGTMESLETCLGATVDLTGMVTPITWTGIPEANFGDGVYLPDDVGTPFTSEIDFTQFDPGQLLTNANDLQSICVSMEHSFTGDLVLSVTCPNGQVIIMHQQGGGGTYIGGANDGDSNANPIPGTCWEYCWSPTATLGTFAECAAFGATPNVMNGGTPPNNALIPGTYSTVQPWNNLQNCPLNGTWTFTSLDLWGADNGFLCSWELNFNPAIIPAVTQFTPVINTSVSDSVFWSGPFITLNPNDPLTATATPTGAGTFDYTLTAIDNFGCTYDTTVTVTVAPQMEIDAGPDIVLCNDPEPMAGAVVANGPPTNCVWQLQLNETFGDTWNGGATLAVNIDGVVTNYAISTAGTLQQIIPLNVSTGQSITLTYTAGSIWNNENSFILTNDMGTQVYASGQGPVTGVSYSGVIVCGGGTSPIVWEWTPTDGLDDPSDPTTNVFTTQATWYYLTSYPLGSPACAVTDSVLVAPDPSIDAGQNNAITVCANEAAFFMNDSLLGTPDPGGEWTNSVGAVVDDQFDPTWETSELFTYTVTSAAGCQATAQLDITVIPADDPACCGIVVMGPGGYSCDLTNGLSVSPGNTGVGVWSGPAGAVFADANATQTTVTVQPGMGGTHWFYWIEDDGAFCYLIDSVQLTFTDTIVIDFTPTDAICYTYCDGTAGAAVTGGNIGVAGDFSFAWSTGQAGIGVNSVTSLCAGTYSLTVTDDNGCTGTNEFFIGEPPQLVIDSVVVRPVTCSGYCDGEVEVYDSQAVLYSFDDGQNWQPEPLLTGACEQYYPIRIQDAAGCLAAGFGFVQGPPPVVADFIWNPIPANVDDPRIWFGNTSTGAETYWWDIAGLMTTNDPSPSFEFSNREPGQYEVCMVAWNQNLCADTICQTVIIDDVLFVYVPNSFSPDGDDINETWGMSTNIDAITSFDLKVFDRWGQVVFQTDDYKNFWNGAANNNGKALKTDVYAYRITYEIKDSETRKELMGHVTLIK